MKTASARVNLHDLRFSEIPLLTKYSSKIWQTKRTVDYNWIQPKRQYNGKNAMFIECTS